MSVMYLQLVFTTLQWRHNAHNGVSNTNLSIVYSTVHSGAVKENIKAAPLAFVGNSPVTGEFPAQSASNAKNVSIWWRHHDKTDSQATMYHNGQLMRFSHMLYNFELSKSHHQISHNPITKYILSLFRDLKQYVGAHAPGGKDAFLAGPDSEIQNGANLVGHWLDFAQTGAERVLCMSVSWEDVGQRPPNRLAVQKHRATEDEKQQRRPSWKRQRQTHSNLRRAHSGGEPTGRSVRAWIGTQRPQIKEWARNLAVGSAQFSRKIVVKHPWLRDPTTAGNSDPLPPQPVRHIMAHICCWFSCLRWPP